LRATCRVGASGGGRYLKQAGAATGSPHRPIALPHLLRCLGAALSCVDRPLRQLREALESVWASVAGKPADAKEAQLLVARCEEQVPHLDDPFTSIFTSPAQNAAIGVLRAVVCSVDGDVELEAFETYVDATEGKGSLYDSELVASSHVYRGELGCQRADLSMLAGTREFDPSVIDGLRERAQAGGFALLVSP
jgi:hypothetical protein